MKKIEAEYTNLCCKVYHEPSGSVLLTDAKKGELSTGFTPPELCAISLATCVASMMGYEAEVLKLDISGMKIAISLEMSNDKPRRISKINAEFWIPCQPTPHQKELLIKIARSCPVLHSLHPDIKENIEFHWQNEE